jgi:GGDEF domain-containing protein
MVLIVADAFDAMTTNRIYKGRKTVLEAVEELERNSGTQFHPDIIQVAAKVLSDVNIEQTTQMPQNDLEKQRFSYFFNDNLTGLYNESYLQLILNQLESKHYVNIVELKNFSKFNKLYGWNRGNEFLISIANQLQMNFPAGKIFRFEGDFFILLDERIIFSKEMLILDKFDTEKVIQIEAKFYEINNSQDIFKLEKYYKIQ